MKKNVLIISVSCLDRDPRIQRQIQAYEGDYNIETLGVYPANEKIKNFQIRTRKVAEQLFSLKKIKSAIDIALGRVEEYMHYFYSIEEICAYDIAFPDMIVANEWDGLYIASELRRAKGWQTKVYYDAHEYSPKEYNTIFWALFLRPQALFSLRQKNSFQVMSTVCPTLARMYEDWFGAGRGTVRVITNSPNYESGLEPHPVGEKIRMIHHGSCARARQLEKMIDMMAYLPADRYELTFMLVKSDAAYYDELVRRAGNFQNVHFIEPVPFSQIAGVTNHFDIGVYILDNKIINSRYALPNKFFEYVQARLAIAVGDSPEMRAYIEKYQLGVSAKKNTPKAMAEEIRKLSAEDIMRFKRNAHEHALELSAEQNIVRLKEIAADLTGNPEKAV